jgi:membrane protein YdbS with pleckstrin-like domain
MPKQIRIYWIIILAVQAGVLIYDFELWPLVLAVTLMGIISTFRTIRLIDQGQHRRKKDHTDKVREEEHDR